METLQNTIAAPNTLAGQSLTSTRRYDLDWLRVLAFGLLIFYHTGMFFVSWEWHIKNNIISEALEPFMIFPNQWRMSLLFLISGAAVYFALDKLTGRKFLWERTKRLFVPLVFGMFFVIPPQIYFERISQGETFSYFSFQQTVFQMQPYPEGSFSWHHLWYLVYIFVYSLVFLPLFLWLKSEKGKRLTKKIAGTLHFPFLIYGFALFQFVDEILLKDDWEISHNLIADWYNHGLSIAFFVMGFLICTHQKFWQVIENQRKWSLGLGLFTATVLYVFYWTPWEDIEGVNLLLYRFIKSFSRWFWILTILGFGKKYLNFTNPFLRYANQAVAPFYILHQTVITFFAYYATNWQIPVSIKFLYISLATFLICWILYEFLIKRWQLLRVVFGLKR
ncbi:MAG: acyltransferase family protein [Verrucomicrobia bacterium]|nr:acyltransferase family protein [Cytophagales bacterium]